MNSGPGVNLLNMWSPGRLLGDQDGACRGPQPACCAATELPFKQRTSRNKEARNSLTTVVEFIIHVTARAERGKPADIRFQSRSHIYM